MPAGGVQVAVRVRPFNSREKGMNAKCCIRMKTPMTWIKNPETGQDKPFTFDYSYWSHSGFKDEDGLLVATDDNYATQIDVYKDLGENVLRNCFDGYNCSLFAYGQTGAGKSYSMVGYGKNKGIIPIVCENMFKRIAENSDANKQYQVTVTMLEIYNEQLRDLLHPSVNKKGGLKIRSNKTMGVYIPGLKDEPVRNYAEIDKKMQEGTMNRTVASTKMNATSSRAHTVFGIMFTQVTIDGELKSENASKVNLVDLAGSERAESTGATGDRLKEGCAINQSLSALGNVISALADKAMGKKKVFVPYRNSVLTQMLQDALGGNSKTIMICALSPADVNYDETLSTLRYADRAKKIKNKIVKNENPTDRAIRLLKEENAKLKKILEGKGMSIGDLKAGEDNGESEDADPAEMKALQDKLKEMEENQKMIDEMKKSWEEKLKEAEARGAEGAAAGGPSLASDASELEVPYLINLHEDEGMTETFLHKLAEGETKCGRKDSAEHQDIHFAGLGIKKEHCIFENKEGQVSVVPLNNGKTFVNGERISQKTILSLGDRVIIGSNFFFRYMTPGDHKELQFKKFQDAMDELMSKQSNNMSDAVNNQMSKLFGADEKAEARALALETELKEMERKMKAAQAEAKRKLEDAQKVFEAKLASGEMTAEQKDMLMSAADKKVQEDEKKLKEEKEKIVREKKIMMSRKKLEQNLDRLIPKVKEANQVAQEMGKPITFEVKLQQRSDTIRSILATDQADRLAVMDPVVIVKNKESGASWTWTKDKFDQRRFLILEMFQEFQEGTLDPRGQADDPFWDPPEPKLIGRAIVFVKCLSHLVEIEQEFDILDLKGKDCGKLDLKMLPFGIEDEEIDYLQDPKELLGMSFKFQVSIDSAKGLPEKYANYTHVNFMFQDKNFVTKMVDGHNTNPSFGFKTTLIFEDAEQELLDYLLNEVAVFEIRGFPEGQTPVVESAEMVLKAKFEKARNAWKEDQENERLKEEFKKAKKDYVEAKKKNKARAKKISETKKPEEKKAEKKEDKDEAKKEEVKKEGAKKVSEANKEESAKKETAPASASSPPTVASVPTVASALAAAPASTPASTGGGTLEDLKKAFESARATWKADQSNTAKKEAFKSAKKKYYAAKAQAEAGKAAESKLEVAKSETKAHSNESSDGLEALKAAFDKARAAWKTNQGDATLKEAFKTAKKTYFEAKKAAGQ